MAHKTLKGKALLKEEDEVSKKKEKKIEPKDNSKTDLEFSSQGDKDEEDINQDALPKNKTEEETALVNNLQGQTIKAADIELQPSGRSFNSTARKYQFSSSTKVE